MARRPLTKGSALSSSEETLRERVEEVFPGRKRGGPSPDEGRGHFAASRGLAGCVVVRGEHLRAGLPESNRPVLKLQLQPIKQDALQRQ